MIQKHIILKKTTVYKSCMLIEQNLYEKIWGDYLVSLIKHIYY